MENRMLQWAYWGCLWLAATLFTSFSAASLFHITMIGTGSYFAFQAYKKKNFRLSLSSWALFALILISVASLIKSGGPYKNAIKMKYFLVAILSVFSFEAISRNYLNEKRVKILLNVFLIASAVASLSGLIGLYTGFNPLRFKAACHTERACGMYGMYMSYGYGMGYFVLVSMLVLFNMSKLKKVSHPAIWLLSNIINFLGFYLSYARGALGAFIAGITIYFFQKRWKLGLSIGVLLVAIGFGLYNSNESFRRMFTERGSSNDQRISLYKGAYYAFQESPLLGLGYRNYEDQSVRIKKQYGIDLQVHFAGTAHNNFLEHLASTGILGFIAMILFHLFWLIEMVKRKDLIGQITIGFIVSLIVSGQVEYTLGDGETLFFLMFIYSWSQISRKVEA